MQAQAAHARTQAFAAHNPALGHRGSRAVRRLTPCHATHSGHSAQATFVPALASAALLLLSPDLPAHAERKPPPRESVETRCTVEALDKFADTRAKFSMEAAGGGMEEAAVDVRGCSFKGLDLRGKVLSGVLMQGADFSDTDMTGIQMSRADARGAIMVNAKLEDANIYGSQFDGADMENVTFDNAILSDASFGRFEGRWANLKDTHFEGALLSSSDVIRACENPTLTLETKRYELGCRATRSTR